MLVDGQPFRTVWMPDKGTVRIIDQRRLPWDFVLLDLRTVAEVAAAIRDMAVRGAGCIGATAAYGMVLAAREAVTVEEWRKLGDSLITTRPTAVNLAWAVRRQQRAVEFAGFANRAAVTWSEAETIAQEDAAACQDIGAHGMRLFETIAQEKGVGAGRPLNVLTHCNAGWLAFVDHGSATAPIYAAHAAGMPVHVWVDETRPRNQGARLTAWELARQGVPHTVIADNTGGHLMQRGLVDVVITGADRVTAAGDVANKIGTYLKALAARDNGLPFYVALPSSTFDFGIHDGVRGIPIEERNGVELTHIEGQDGMGRCVSVRLVPTGSAVANHAFDVTPARLVTALITERGVCEAEASAIRRLFPDR